MVNTLVATFIHKLLIEAVFFPLRRFNELESNCFASSSLTSLTLIFLLPFAASVKISTISSDILLDPAIRKCGNAVRNFEGEVDQLNYRQAKPTSVFELNATGTSLVPGIYHVSLGMRFLKPASRIFYVSSHTAISLLH